MDSIKKVPDVGENIGVSTDNKLGGGLITKHNFKAVIKIKRLRLNANGF